RERLPSRLVVRRAIAGRLRVALHDAAVAALTDERALADAVAIGVEIAAARDEARGVVVVAVFAVLRLRVAGRGSARADRRLAADGVAVAVRVAEEPGDRLPARAIVGSAVVRVGGSIAVAIALRRDRVTPCVGTRIIARSITRRIAHARVDAHL